MKGFLAILLLALIGISVLNIWQIREMEQEIAVLDKKVHEQQRRADASDRLFAQVADALAHANQALSHADTKQAQDAFEAARRKLTEAAKSLQQQAGPATNWLQEHVRKLVGGGATPPAPAR